MTYLFEFTSSSDNKKRSRTERGSDAEPNDSSEDDTSTLETPRSRLAKRKRASRQRKSKLSKQVNLNSTDSPTDDDRRRQRVGKSANSSMASTPQRQDNDGEANDSDFLDDLAGELDDEIE